MSAAPKNNNLIQLKLVKKRSESSSWALSYGDIVTVLLCFFIIFYAFEKQIEKKIIVTKTSITGAPVSQHEANGIQAEFNYAIESLEKTEGIEVKRTSDFVDINFRKTVFFKKGKSSLTLEGKNELERVVSKLTKLQGKYTLEIQGHADSTRVKNRKGRWWQNNMELSVLRALDVHSFLAVNHINKDQLIVSGHGNQKSFNDENNINDDFNRRISLRLQLVK